MIGCKYVYANLVGFPTSGVVLGAFRVIHKGSLDASLVMKQSSLALGALTMKLKQIKCYLKSTFQLSFAKMGSSFKSGITVSTRGTIQAYGVRECEIEI
ncbi:hypothetical protein P8452_29583 [Trifolium repens]|nr:hypothetical protein P8452_29583 [Trifolium repens]